MHERSALLRRASIIALVGNAVLAVSKLVIGSLAGSLAVVSDGVDSSTDVAIAIMTLVISTMVDKPGDKEHPYGHARAETMATTALAFIVFFAGAQLFIRAGGALIEGERPVMPGVLAILVTAFSVVGKLLLAWSQFAYGKKTGSAMLVANGKNMRGDVVTSASVLVGLAITYIFGIPVLDRVLALLVSLWIMKNAIGIFSEANTELMDGSTDRGPYGFVFQAVASVPGAGNPHRTRIRKLGSRLMVDLDIEVEPSMSVRDAHDIAREVEKAIKTLLPDVYDIVVHVEPKGNREEEERYGLKPGDHES
jgi:cation diffusion facilitator family transporter